MLIIAPSRDVKGIVTTSSQTTTNDTAPRDGTAHPFSPFFFLLLLGEVREEAAPSFIVL